MLTLGYAIAIVAFIRVGEKLLQRFGARKPMIWGSLIVGLSIAMLMPTQLLLRQYTILAVASYTLFGLGLAFYATPSTDAALSNLPDDQAGSGSGLYKMASSLGASFGVAISAAIFTALSGDSGSTRWLEGVITFAGRQDNVAVRQAALIALAFNLLDGRGCHRVHRPDDTQRPHAGSPAIGARRANQAGTVALNRPRRASGANSASGVDPRRTCSGTPCCHRSCGPLPVTAPDCAHVLWPY